MDFENIGPTMRQSSRDDAVATLAALVVSLAMLNRQLALTLRDGHSAQLAADVAKLAAKIVVDLGHPVPHEIAAGLDELCK